MHWKCKISEAACCLLEPLPLAVLYFFWYISSLYQVQYLKQKFCSPVAPHMYTYASSGLNSQQPISCLSQLSYKKLHKTNTAVNTEVLGHTIKNPENLAAAIFVHVVTGTEHAILGIAYKNNQLHNRAFFKSSSCFAGSM